MATEMLNLQNEYSKINSPEAIRGVKLKLCIIVYSNSLYKSIVFIAIAQVLWLPLTWET